MRFSAVTIRRRHTVPSLLSIVVAGSLFGIVSSSAGATVLGQQRQPLESPGKTSRRGWLEARARTRPVLYVVDFDNSLVDVYSQASPHNLVGQLFAGLDRPYGDAVDSSGNLLVANSASNTVTEYAPGTTVPSMTYRAGLGHPVHVAVSPAGRIVVSGDDSVVEFQEGSKKLVGRHSIPGPVYGLAFDAADNLYVASFGSAPSTVYELAANSKRVVDLGFESFLVGPMDVAVDTKGNLVILDGSQHTVFIVPPGAKQPSRQIAPGNLQLPNFIALNARGNRLYLSDLESGLFEYNYQQGSFLANIGNCYFGPPSGVACEGVALSPALP